MIRRMLLVSGGAALLVALAGCPSQQSSQTEKTTETPAAKLVGVDPTAKIVKIGALNDESGPAAAIGKPYAVGKRILVAQVNAGNSGLLPEGWKLELVEKDHGYNPQNAVQAYNEIKDQVLFIGTSFGTPNTLPLRPMLKRDNLVAFPASLSSKMAEHPDTPPLGPGYNIEAMRAMDWVVEQAGDAKKVKAGIVYQQDDYGADGLAGWEQAAKHHGVEIVSKQAVAPGQKDVTAVIAALQKAGATHVLLTVLPSATGPIVGTAAKLKYMPTWVGNTPTWIDRFFDPEVIPSAVFGKFYWISGLPYWGEDLPGMKEFQAAYDTYGKDLHPPDFYVLASYIQGRVAIEALNKTIAGGDLSRDGYFKAVTSLSNYDAGGFIQPFNLTKFPYEVSTRTRILKPNFETKSWDQVADYAEPASLGDKPKAELGAR